MIQSKYDPKLRKRYWKCVFYPESLPNDWIDFMQNTDLPFCISPIHDKDINEDQENTQKKAHYHIIIAYNNPTTWKNVKESICDPLNQPRCMPSDNIKLAYRYLWHADNPEKYQYNEEDVQTFNGFNIHNYMALTNDEVHAYMNECTNMIRELNIIEYSDLIFFLIDNEMYEHLNVAQSHTIYFNALIRSLRHKYVPNNIKRLSDDKQESSAQNDEIEED
jgi:hypothetical protein